MAIASNLTANSVNNGRRTPFQGFDVSIYVQDQATGTLIPFGEFTGFQHVVRNASEPYLPLGNRTMNILDGEFQIGWVAEQGKINLEAMRHVFGFSVIGPVVRLGRSPRFQIVVEYNAPDLEEAENQNNQFLYNDLYANSLNPAGIASGPLATQEATFDTNANGVETTDNVSNRVTSGRYVFGYCKIDAFTTGIMAGRTAVADRIEGLAETWYWRPFQGSETPVSKKITLENVTQETYFKGASGITPLQVPAWAYGASGTVYRASANTSNLTLANNGG